MRKTLKWAAYSFLFIIGIAACEKNDPEIINVIDPDPVAGKKGTFILCEGSFGHNNSSLDYFDYATGAITPDILEGKLGDTANDMLLYGNKIYIIVSTSGIIFVIDPETGEEIKKIEVKNSTGASREPRYLTGYNGKVYSSTFDGNVIKIDTTSLNIEAITKVGSNPEGLACANGKLYVANSDAFNPNGLGTTVSVVNLSTFKEEKTLTVGLNPYLLKTDQYEDVYLSFRGDYEDIPGGFQRIDSNDIVNTINGLQVYKFEITGDSCYFYNTTYNPDWTTNTTVGIFNIQSEQLVNNQAITDGTVLTTAYGIGVNPGNRDLYIADTDYQNPGKVYIFGSDGKKKRTIPTGINPSTFAFY